MRYRNDNPKLRLDVALPPFRLHLFWAKTEVHVCSECILWTGAFDSKGYGNFWFPEVAPGGTVKAHRLAYRIIRGPIPEGLELDHLCETKACVNPYHLEAVEGPENNRRRHEENRFKG